MRALSVLALALTIAGCAAQPVMTSDGLVSEPSGKFDELYLRPNGDLLAYRRVLIEPVPVNFRGDYLDRQHAYNALLAQPLHKPHQDPEAMAQDLSTLMQTSLANAFRAANYEIVDERGPG